MHAQTGTSEFNLHYQRLKKMLKENSLNKNLKVEMVVGNLETYIRAKSVFMQLYLDLNNKVQFFEPQIRALTENMRALEVSAAEKLDEMERAKLELTTLMGQQGSEQAGGVCGIEKIENMVRVMSDINMYLDDPLLFDGAGSSDSPAILCDLITRHKPQLASFYKLFSSAENDLQQAKILSADNEESKQKYKSFSNQSKIQYRVMNSIHSLFIESVAHLLKMISDKLCQINTAYKSTGKQSQ